MGGWDSVSFVSGGGSGLGMISFFLRDGLGEVVGSLGFFILFLEMC